MTSSAVLLRTCGLALIVLAASALGALGACSDGGTTPDCPELPLYDVRDAGLEGGINADLDPNADPDDPTIQRLRALREAAEQGCITYPVRPPPGDGDDD
jgi:hypothetical protein